MLIWFALLGCKEGAGPASSVEPTPTTPAVTPPGTPPAGASCDAVQADLDAACAACHGEASLGQLSTTDLGALVGRASTGSALPLVTPGSPDESYLFHKVAGTHLDVGGVGTSMPPGEPYGADAEARMASWITAGAVCDAGPPEEPPAPTTRRLSNVELANTLDAVLGVRPEALSLLPPDGHGFTFDRVVAGQTVSRAHLDAWYAIAEGAAQATVTEAVLPSLSDACIGVELPPAVPSSVTRLTGAELTLGPEWSVGVDPVDPTISTTTYAPDPTVGASLSIPADGRYTLTLELDSNYPIQQLEVRVDGTLLDTVSVDGPSVVTVEVDRTAGPLVFDAHLITIPEEHNLDVSYIALSAEGPLDTGDASTRAPCAAGLVTDVGEQLYRRPLTVAESDRLMALYDAADGLAAFHQLMIGMIASPHTLYLVEVGTEVTPGVFELDAYERAARLSYALCEEPPDAELTLAAESGALLDPDEMEAQARRLLNSPCGQEGLQRFVGQWLHLHRLEGLNKSPEAFPGFDADTLDGLQSESSRYVYEMVYPQDATLEGFFTSPVAWPDPRSSWLMGLDVATQTETPLPPERRGILTQPAFLAVTARFAETSPVDRGVFVLEQLLCDHLPPPPANLDVAPPVPDPNLTTRERWSQHSDDPLCFDCHSLIDPVGFAFEGFDGVGQYRTTENGLPLDTTGGIPSLGIADGTLDGGVEMSVALAESDRLGQCFSKQWLRGTLGRLDHPDDSVSVAEIAGVAATDSMMEALVALVRTPAFTHRYGDAP